MNVIRVPGYKDWIINNVVVKFRTGCEMYDLREIAKVFGTNIFPIKPGGAHSASWARRKVVMRIRERSDEWYSQVPDSIKTYENELKNMGLYDTMFQQYLQEKRLEKMRKSVEDGNSDYRITEWTNPSLQPLTTQIYRRTRVVVAGLDSIDQGLYFAHYFVRYLNSFGIYAQMLDFTVVNIVCDTKLGFAVDLKLLQEKLGDLADLDEEEFPACIVEDPENNKFKLLVYPNGSIVGTGFKTFDEAVKRTTWIEDLCKQTRASDSSSTRSNSSNGSGSIRQRYAQNKRQTSGEHLQKVNQRIRELTRKLENPEDYYDDDEEEDGEKNTESQINIKSIHDDSGNEPSGMIKSKPFQDDVDDSNKDIDEDNDKDDPENHQSVSTQNGISSLIEHEEDDDKISEIPVSFFKGLTREDILKYQERQKMQQKEIQSSLGNDVGNSSSSINNNNKKRKRSSNDKDKSDTNTNSNSSSNNNNKKKKYVKMSTNLINIILNENDNEEQANDDAWGVENTI